jgi:hypothetical protein
MALIVVAILYITKGDKVADWLVALFTLATAIGEFLIVWAIVSEVRGTRETEYLKTVFDPNFYSSRSTLYKEFVNNSTALPSNPDRKALWKASEAFLQKLLTTSELRKDCDIQLAHLTQVSFIYGKHQDNDPLIEWFPHASVLCWIILLHYIFERKKLQGHFWAKKLDSYTLACINFILLDEEAELSVYGTDAQRKVTINNAALVVVKQELEELGKCQNRKEVRDLFATLNKRNS